MSYHRIHDWVLHTWEKNISRTPSGVNSGDEDVRVAMWQGGTEKLRDISPDIVERR